MPRQAIVRAILVLAVLAGALPQGLAHPGGPHADFAYAPGAPVVHETVTFTSLSHADVRILVHRWSFGDGSEDVLVLGSEAEHTFARPGVYEVTLTVTDASGASGVATRLVEVESAAPLAAFDFAPSPAFRGQAVVFQDNSTDPDGDAIVAWEWSFGDGMTARGAAATHTYDAIGSHEVRLVVTDTHGKQGAASALVRVLNAPPRVAAAFSPSAPRAGEAVVFAATGTDPDGDSSALTYAWTFSDGATATGASVERAFARPGDYVASVRARDSEGAFSEPVPLAVRVGYTRPTADFAVSPSVPVAGRVAAFDDASTSPNGPIVAWSWSFGDGVQSARRSPSHVFAASGTHLVTLAVTDAANQTASVSRQVRVNAPPQAGFHADPAGAVGVGQPVRFTDVSHDEEGAVASWRWAFGDGSESTERHPTHAYAAPGSYPVRLEVADSDGATATYARIVQVANQRPVASFSYSPRPPLASAPVQFVSESFDPDGEPLTSWSWSFGDGATSTREHPVHTYAASGRRLVSLAAGDGFATGQAHAFVDVAADHAFRARLAAALPDGRLQDLGAPEIQLRAMHLRAGIATQVPFELDGHAAVAALPAGAWMQGDALRLSVRDVRYMEEAREVSFALRDGQGEASARIELAMPLAPTLDVAPGERAPLGQGGERAPDGTPIYRDPAERFHGEGRVAFLDGFAAAGVEVVVHARLAAIEDAPWCVVARVITDAEGRYAWTARDDASCPTVAPGRYVVVATAAHAHAPAGRSQAARVLVDPTGTGLAGATLP